MSLMHFGIVFAWIWAVLSFIGFMAKAKDKETIHPASVLLWILAIAFLIAYYTR